jgi:hypothetical protein
LSPRLAAVSGFKDATAVSVEHSVFPRSFARFPQRRVNNLWIARIDQHIARADVLIVIKNFFECFSPIERSINAAFFVRPIGMTDYGNKDAVWIFWIDGQLRDLLTVAQSEMRPRLSGVSRFINAVADRKVRPMQSFTAANVNDVRI